LPTAIWKKRAKKSVREPNKLQYLLYLYLSFTMASTKGLHIAALGFPNLSYEQGLNKL